MQFQDDGGTRAWRANQATYMVPPARPKLTFYQLLVLIVFVGFVLPWMLILGTPAVGALWNWAAPT